MADATVAALAERDQRRQIVRRRLVVLADQAVSSASNILVAVLVARSVGSAESFGAFALAMVAYQIVLSAVRALVGEPVLSLYSHESPDIRRGLIPDTQGATVLLGLGCSLVLWPVAVLLGGVSGAALLALAALLPFVLVQDTWRYLFVVDRPGAALVVDSVWLALLVLALPLAADGASVAWFVLVWGLGGALGGAVGAILGLRSVDRPHPWRWLAGHRAVSLRFLGESTTGQALGHALMVGLGAIAGLGALGAVRAAQVFFGPLNTLHSATYLAIVPEGAAIRDRPAQLHDKLRKVSLALAAIVAGWVVVGVLLPSRWGRELFGTTWDDADGLILAMGLAAVAAGLQSGGILGLRSLADARRSMRTQLQVIPWLVACPLVGAAVGDALGFAVGTAVGTAIAATRWWASFRGALHDVEQ